MCRKSVTAAVNKPQKSKAHYYTAFSRRLVLQKHYNTVYVDVTLQKYLGIIRQCSLKVMVIFTQK